MPPRGRPRKGLKRIDAAIDAMLPLGFTVKQVRKCVKELLKVYGGDKVGWRFIEDAAYSELIAALLRDVEKESQEELALDGNQIMQDQNLLKEKSNGEEEPIVTDERALDTLQDEISPAKSVAVAEPVLDGEGWRGTLPDQTSPHVEETINKEDPPTKVDSPRIRTALPSVPTKRKKQLLCYGWIEDDDEEEEPAVTDERALDTLQDEISPAKSVVVAELVLYGEGWRSTLPDQTSAHVEEATNKEDPPTKVDSPRIRTALPSVPTKRKKQFPCYGWIDDDDEEEDDFITFPLLSMVLGPPKARKY